MWRLTGEMDSEGGCLRRGASIMKWSKFPPKDTVLK